jgi:hypothetical protein
VRTSNPTKDVFLLYNSACPDTAVHVVKTFKQLHFKILKIHHTALTLFSEGILLCKKKLWQSCSCLNNSNITCVLDEDTDMDGFEVCSEDEGLISNEALIASESVIDPEPQSESDKLV